MSKNAESILVNVVDADRKMGNMVLIDAKDGVAWTDFGNTYYYRYTFHYGTYYLTAAAAILIHICLAYKNTRVIYEIFVSRILVGLYAEPFLFKKSGKNIGEYSTAVILATCSRQLV